MKTISRLVLFLALIAQGAFAQVPIYNKSPVYNSSSIFITGGTLSGVGKDTMESDAAARSTTLAGANAYPQAAVNTTGGNFSLSPGIGRRLVTVVDYSLIDLPTDTITITVNGSANVGTATAATQDATNFIAATSNAVTATNICTWADQLTGVTAVAVTDKCYITADSTTYSIALATSMDAGEGTVTSGTDGVLTIYGGSGASRVLMPAGSAAAPSYSFTTTAEPSSDTGFFVSASDTLAVSTGGAARAIFYGSYFALLNTTAVAWASGDPTYVAPDSYISRYAAKQLMISGDGVGATTNAGWILGYGGASGYSIINNSGAAATIASSALFANTTTTNVNAPDGGTITIGVGNNSAYGRIQLSGVAGLGPSILTGTATTAVSPLAITQTWNAAGVTFPGLTLTITDTASAAGSLAMQILGGALGTTPLFSVSKGGNALTGSGLQATPGLAVGEAISGLWLTGASTLSIVTGGSAKATIGSAVINIGSTLAIGFSSAADPSGTAADSGISRLAAGLIGVGTGAAGSFAGRLKLTSAIVAGTTIANLNASPTAGEIATITDQTVACPAKGVAPTAGGAFVCPVFYNGSAWVGI